MNVRHDHPARRRQREMSDPVPLQSAVGGVRPGQAADDRLRAGGVQGAVPRGRFRVPAGLLLLLGGAGTLLGIITAEALYPVPFDPGVNTVSDLAAMRPENLVRQPSAAIFDATMITMGACIAAGTLLWYRLERRLSTTIPLLALSVGMIGVGVVHGDHLVPHTVLAYAAFLGGGLAALLGAGSQPGPLRPVHRVLGTLSLGTLVGYTLLRDTPPMQALGEGGAERLVVVLFLVVLGTTLALPRAAPEPPS